MEKISSVYFMLDKGSHRISEAPEGNTGLNPVFLLPLNPRSIM